MKGRKPKPTTQRALTGNAGHRPLNTHEPVTPALDATFDTPPPELPPRAQAEWTRLAPLLRRSRQVGATDRTALMAVCIEWARYLDAMAKVTQLGVVVTTPAGYPMTNPYLSVATRALAACTKLWPELGLTPSSRSRISVLAVPSPDDPFAEFDAPPLSSVALGSRHDRRKRPSRSRTSNRIRRIGARGRSAARGSSSNPSNRSGPRGRS